MDRAHILTRKPYFLNLPNTFWTSVLSSEAIQWIIIGVSLSEPHTNQYYEKIAVFMYVCMYVCMYVAIRRPRVC